MTIEETRELYLDHALEDVCSLESRPMLVNQITVRDLVKNALRMRPHRVIVGEVRGPEALDMLMAMTSGHEGSMCTIHADSAREALFKLHTYALMSGEGVPSTAIHEMIARAIQLVIFCKRERDGEQRVIDTIFEVTGVQGGVISGQEIWVQKNAELSWTGIRPQIEARLKERGHDLTKIFREPAGGWERRSHW